MCEEIQGNIVLTGVFVELSGSSDIMASIDSTKIESESFSAEPAYVLLVEEQQMHNRSFVRRQGCDVESLLSAAPPLPKLRKTGDLGRSICSLSLLC